MRDLLRVEVERASSDQLLERMLPKHLITVAPARAPRLPRSLPRSAACGARGNEV